MSKEDPEESGTTEVRSLSLRGAGVGSSMWGLPEREVILAGGSGASDFFALT